MHAHSLARVLAATVLMLLGGLADLQAQTSAGVQAEASALAGEHPSEYYRRTARLFGDGRKDDAVFMFYLGQLRYRAHLAARPNQKPDGDPALFASLQETVGRPLNEYAFGEIPALARTIEAVLAHDAANPDRFTPPAQFAQAHAGIRDGLGKMKDQMLRDAESIRATRSKNGLPNRN